MISCILPFIVVYYSCLLYTSHKHGKEEFFKLQNVMHKARDFKKIQEILGQNTQEGLRILEGFMKTEADV